MLIARLIICVILLAASCSGISAASSRRTSRSSSTRRARSTETSFSLSGSFPSIFLGDEHMNNPGQQSALRAKLSMVLDTVEPHYSDALHRVHELREPKVASLLQELLLLTREGATGSGRHLEASIAPAGAEAAEEDAVGLRRRSDRETSSPKPPKPLSKPLSTLPSPQSLVDWSHKIGSRLAQLPAGTSFPVLRRLLTAVVVRAWLDGAGKRLTEVEEEAVSGLFVQLYMLHRRGAMNRGIMDYQHVSKSGGTSWCHAAQLNGCTTQRFDRFFVCGVSSFDDKVRWVDGAAHTRLTGAEPTRWYLHGTYRSEGAPGCASRAAQMLANRWTYYRNPLRRLASHLRFILLHYKRFMTAQVEEGVEKSADFFTTYAGANASFWSSVAPAISDNYFARTLLGEAAWHAPVGGITADTHLAPARLVLMQYDIVVPLESPTELTSRLLAFGAGWPVSYTDVHDKNITALQEMFDFDPSPHMPSSDEMDILYGRQQIDMDLYGLAVLIGQLDYLVYSTAAAAGVVPWDGMPDNVNPEEDNVNYRVACGLLRGPGGAWSSHMVHRRRRANGGAAGRETRVRRRSDAASLEETSRRDQTG
ncbi:hypothetical protein VOLCADRAFT_98124 [Volvox carteri f. nagariensis]|uniref:Uncharacterized protein n=1 Tax=Volvox carteri f. nagariensis TaxID=3068 RepID=D8UEI2_VOLCA|nr:uncharacterized protein VOLCADRAFT_98124 [Volvox carteri f. nagariensis]EFJ41887.1 hypothetical protein VOLCADRAFT_98124 [Volvox carteri f. nagariensis]|eukprot:XP_002957085.1 hypothetical protein VOLCADRAFT_98124 [Volvox carteri f. nagariensis]